MLLQYSTTTQLMLSMALLFIFATSVDSVIGIDHLNNRNDDPNLNKDDILSHKTAKREAILPLVKMLNKDWPWVRFRRLRKKDASRIDAMPKYQISANENWQHRSARHEQSGALLSGTRKREKDNINEHVKMVSDVADKSCSRNPKTGECIGTSVNVSTLKRGDITKSIGSLVDDDDLSDLDNYIVPPNQHVGDMENENSIENTKESNFEDIPEPNNVNSESEKFQGDTKSPEGIISGIEHDEEVDRCKNNNCKCNSGKLGICNDAKEKKHHVNKMEGNKQVPINKLQSNRPNNGHVDHAHGDYVQVDFDKSDRQNGDHAHAQDNHEYAHADHDYSAHDHADRPHGDLNNRHQKGGHAHGPHNRNHAHADHEQRSRVHADLENKDDQQVDHSHSHHDFARIGQDHSAHLPADSLNTDLDNRYHQQGGHAHAQCNRIHAHNGHDQGARLHSDRAHSELENKRFGQGDHSHSQPMLKNAHANHGCNNVSQKTHSEHSQTNCTNAEHKHVYHKFNDHESGEHSDRAHVDAQQYHNKHHGKHVSGSLVHEDQSHDWSNDKKKHGHHHHNFHHSNHDGNVLEESHAAGGQIRKFYKKMMTRCLNRLGVWLHPKEEEKENIEEGRVEKVEENEDKDESELDEERKARLQPMGEEAARQMCERRINKRLQNLPRLEEAIILNQRMLFPASLPRSALPAHFVAVVLARRSAPFSIGKTPPANTKSKTGANKQSSVYEDKAHIIDRRNSTFRKLEREDRSPQKGKHEQDELSQSATLEERMVTLPLSKVHSAKADVLTPKLMPDKSSNSAKRKITPEKEKGMGHANKLNFTNSYVHPSRNASIKQPVTIGPIVRRQISGIAFRNSDFWISLKKRFAKAEDGKKPSSNENTARVEVSSPKNAFTPQVISNHSISRRQISRISSRKTDFWKSVKKLLGYYQKPAIPAKRFMKKYKVLIRSTTQLTPLENAQQQNNTMQEEKSTLQGNQTPTNTHFIAGIKQTDDQVIDTENRYPVTLSTASKLSDPDDERDLENRNANLARSNGEEIVNDTQLRYTLAKSTTVIQNTKYSEEERDSSKTQPSRRNVDTDESNTLDLVKDINHTYSWSSSTNVYIDYEDILMQINNKTGDVKRMKRQGDKDKDWGSSTLCNTPAAKYVDEPVVFTDNVSHVYPELNIYILMAVMSLAYAHVVLLFSY